jgi:hypothetical protein
LKKSDEIGAMRRCKYSRENPLSLRFAPSLTPIASLVSFNELMTQDTCKAKARQGLFSDVTNPDFINVILPPNEHFIKICSINGFWRPCRMNVMRWPRSGAMT